MSEPRTPTVMGRWQLVRRLNTGGNGEVWEAIQHASSDNQSVVAIKILHRLDRYARFSSEVELLLSLGRGRGVLPILDHNLPVTAHKRDRPWLVMPIAIPIREALRSDSNVRVVVTV